MRTKYLRHDLLNAWQNAGLSTIVISCMPVWFFLVYQLVHLVFHSGFGVLPAGALGAAYILAFILAVVFLPVQIYGRVTDKRPGSNWLLLPASRFEKFFSILLVTCVALPIVFCAVLIGSDYLMSLIFGSSYGGPVLATIFDRLGSILDEIHSDNVRLAFSGPYALYLSWCSNILFFTLGAIFFRKNKTVYTILSAFGIGLLITVVSGIFVANGFDFNFEPGDINEDSLMRTVNAVLFIIYLVEFALLDLGIYFRVKTLKH